MLPAQHSRLPGSPELFEFASASQARYPETELCECSQRCTSHPHRAGATAIVVPPRLWTLFGCSDFRNALKEYLLINDDVRLGSCSPLLLVLYGLERREALGDFQRIRELEIQRRFEQHPSAFFCPPNCYLNAQEPAPTELSGSPARDLDFSDTDIESEGHQEGSCWFRGGVIVGYISDCEFN